MFDSKLFSNYILQRTIPRDRKSGLKGIYVYMLYTTSTQKKFHSVWAGATSVGLYNTAKFYLVLIIVVGKIMTAPATDTDKVRKL
jgi:hypothetical protein